MIMSNAQEDDINKTFENLFLAEEIAAQLGYEEGFDAGKKQLFEGYHLGYHRASLLAAELGYYFGVLMQCLQPTFPEKIIEQARKLQKDITDFPVSNDDTVDIFVKFDDIKLKFKRLCSLAKIDFSYPEADKLNF